MGHCTETNSCIEIIIESNYKKKDVSFDHHANQLFKKNINTCATHKILGSVYVIWVFT